MRTYPQYEDSGVEWIGEIPKGWNLTKLTRVCTKIRNGYVGPTRDIMKEDGVKYIQGIHIKSGEIKYTPNGPYYVSPEWSDQHNETLLEEGDVLVVQTGTIGEVGYVTREFENSNCHALIIVRINKNIGNGRFLLYSFLGSYIQNYLQSIKTGEILYHINTKKLRFLHVLTPPLPEQKQISDYLDRKTQQIDDLIEKTEQKIELLKEQRSSLINQCVTMGLDPTVEMKDSGVEWIGEIPKHWMTSKIKYIHKQNENSFIDGDWIESPHIDDDGIRYITTGNIGEGRFKYQGNGHISEDTFQELNCTEVFPGDLIISRLSPPVGRSCIIPDLGKRIVTSVDNVIIRLQDDFLKNYYNYIFNSKNSYENTSTLSRGATLTRISRSILGDIETLVPPLSEQKQISNYLDQETGKIDRTIDTETKRSNLLKEYRQSLISNVVTGKIDVRDEVIQ